MQCSPSAPRCKCPPTFHRSGVRDCECVVVGGGAEGRGGYAVCSDVL